MYYSPESYTLSAKPHGFYIFGPFEVWSKLSKLLKGGYIGSSIGEYYRGY